MTNVEIANAALALVKKEGIQSFDDETTQARACKALFAPIRDKTFEDRIWSFSKGQYILDAPLAQAPKFGWAYQFQMPGEMIAPVHIEDANGAPVAYDTQGRNILTDNSKIYVTAKTKTEDASLFSPGFCFAVAVHLASYLAVPLAENREMKVDYFQQYQKLIKEAAGADGSGQSSTGARPSDLKLKRY